LEIDKKMWECYFYHCIVLMYPAVLMHCKLIENV